MSRAVRVPGPAGPRWARWVGGVAARTLWRTEVRGAERVPRSGPVLLAANHTGLLDGPLVLGVAPRGVHFLVKESMFRWPIGPVLRAAGQIPVDRSSGRTALSTALAVLRRGGVVGIFPEGNRGRGDAASARAGVAWLALAADAPVVPVAVLGTRRTGESVNRLPGPGRRLVVEFGEPLTVRRPDGASGRVALTHVTDRIRDALSDLVQVVSGRTGVPLPADAPLGDPEPDDGRESSASGGAGEDGHHERDPA